MFRHNVYISVINDSIYILFKCIKLDKKNNKIWI